MTRDRHRLFDVIDLCVAVTAQHLCAEPTLASTGLHSNGRSILTLACALALYKRCSIRRQGREETMGSRCFWWHQERHLAPAWLSRPWSGATLFVLLRLAAGTPRKPPREPVGAIFSHWRAPQGSGERTDGLENHESTMCTRWVLGLSFLL